MENTLYIVDDHEMLREGVKHWLESHTCWKVSKSFGTGEECIKDINGDVTDIKFEKWNN